MVHYRILLQHFESTDALHEGYTFSSFAFPVLLYLEAPHGSVLGLILFILFSADNDDDGSLSEGRFIGFYATQG